MGGRQSLHNHSTFNTYSLTRRFLGWIIFLVVIIKWRHYIDKLIHKMNTRVRAYCDVCRVLQNVDFQANIVCGRVDFWTGWMDFLYVTFLNLVDSKTRWLHYIVVTFYTFQNSFSCNHCFHSYGSYFQKFNEHTARDIWVGTKLQP